MTITPALAAFGVLLVIGTMAFTVGAMYLGGGSGAVRRQLPRLGLFAAVLVAVLVAIPLLMSTLGDIGWAAVLVGLNVGVFAAWAYQARRGEGPLVAERHGAAFRMPAFRTLVIIWLGALAIGTILLVLAAKAAY